MLRERRAQRGDPLRDALGKAMVRGIGKGVLVAQQRDREDEYRFVALSA
jgi:hypothetical protein